MIHRAQHATQATTAQLQAVLERQALPQKARQAATHLLRRLSNPVRVSLFGSPDAGKSTLMNVLAGKTILTPGQLTCPVALSYGELEKTVVTTGAGGQLELDGVDIDGAIAAGAARIDVQLPLGSLQDISLLETAIDRDDPDMPSQMSWAVNRTDICLWCSRGFTAADSTMWHHVPEALKDHAYLVVTKVDQLSEPGALKEHLTALAPVINSEFHAVLPVAGRAALAALEARDTEIDVARWTGSGADALTKAIRQHAARGRREDLDNAQLFLARFGNEGLGARPESAPVVAPTPAPKLAATPPPAAQAAKPLAQEPPTEHAPELWMAAAQTLAASAAPMREVAAIEDGPQRLSGILEACGDVVAQITEFAEENSAAMGDDLIDALFEATEMITLLQMEGGEMPCLDAIALVTQLKSEFVLQAAA